jgi:hypothetical protein
MTNSYNWKGSVQVWGWQHTKSFYSNKIKHEFKTKSQLNETKHICTQVGECTCGIYQTKALLKFLLWTPKFVENHNYSKIHLGHFQMAHWFSNCSKKFNVSCNVVGLQHENKLNGQKLWSFEKSWWKLKIQFGMLNRNIIRGSNDGWLKSLI